MTADRRFWRNLCIFLVSLFVNLNTTLLPVFIFLPLLEIILDKRVFSQLNGQCYQGGALYVQNESEIKSSPTLEKAQYFLFIILAVHERYSEWCERYNIHMIIQCGLIADATDISV